ncbi:MAG TPA: NAD(+)/NADH kinase, partial [Desulfarculaceae bacterium]|nr:NAD(+)/NADH kinase [Desulfarculaceae bacterium]
MQNIGIIIKSKNQRALEIGVKLGNWLIKERGKQILCESALADQLQLSGLSKDEIAIRANLIVVLGGDGTLLSIARHIQENSRPILGVNLGGLGFLTAITLDELLQVMAEVLAGNYSLSRRMALNVALYRGKRMICRHNVLNDIVINKGAMARIIDLKTVIDNNLVNTFKADGLIFATPTGSTGYSMSAGGPIVYPTLNSITVAPICPHTLSNRPLIVPPEVNIETTLTSTDSDDVFLTLDGQTGFSMQPLDRIVITKSSHSIELVTSPSKTYFEVLR